MSKRKGRAGKSSKRGTTGGRARVADPDWLTARRCWIYVGPSSLRHHPWSAWTILATVLVALAIMAAIHT